MAQTRPLRFNKHLVSCLLVVSIGLGATAIAFPQHLHTRNQADFALTDFLGAIPEKIGHPEKVRTDLAIMFEAYGEYCRGVKVVDKRIYLVMKNDIKIIYDDGKVKSFAEKLDNPDLEDMLSQLYFPGEAGQEILDDYDPGRFRVSAFFQAVYGTTPHKVKANLITVNFLGATIQFNSQNGAARSLAEVAHKLSALVQRKPELRKYLFPMGGSFNYRTIAGTKRLSPHSWGIAIDLNPKYGAYWRWRKLVISLDILEIRRKYPSEIVAIFEEHGFIWGGKWSHFDTMHFEYRPELLLKTRLIKNYQNRKIKE